MKKGEKIICMPGIDYSLDFQEGYYLEETVRKDGSFYITTKEEMINTFSGTTDEIHSRYVFLITNPDYIKPYTPENFDKYFNRYVFVNNLSHIYYYFFKWYKINYDFQYFYDTELYKKLIKNFSFVRIRFIIELLKLGLFGFLKRVYYFLCFFIDIVRHLFDAYFAYKESINQLRREIYASNTFIMRASVSREKIQEGIKEKENQVSIAKEKYFKINTTLITLIISFIALFSTIILNRVEVLNLNKKIIQLEQHIVETQISLEQRNKALQSIIEEKDIEINRLKQIETDLKFIQLETKYLEVDNEISSKLLSISEIIKNIKNK